MTAVSTIHTVKTKTRYQTDGTAAKHEVTISTTRELFFSSVRMVKQDLSIKTTQLFLMGNLRRLLWSDVSSSWSAEASLPARR